MLVRALGVLAAMAALFLQVIVVQPHAHAQSRAGAPHYERSTVGHADHHDALGAIHAQSGCFICPVFATSGQSIAANAQGISDVFRSPREAAAQAIPLAPRTLTHSWRSRAPPTAL